jgi:hypothetical protein
MSDKELGRKEVEWLELEPFLQAYKWTTGGALSVIESGENPDFVCIRPTGDIIGIELTKVTRRRDVAKWERILESKEEMAPYDMLIAVQALLDRKETARRARYAAHVPQTMLVLQLVDGSLDVLHRLLDGSKLEFEAHGFAEVWLADYSGLEAYGDIELFGLSPESWWGYHRRPWPDRKSYG